MARVPQSQDQQLNEFNMLGEFASRADEYSFQCAKWHETRKRIRYVCIITALAYLAALVSDYFVLGANLKLALMAGGRFIVFSFGIVTFSFTLPAACNAVRLSWALCVYMFAIILCESLELVVKQGILVHESMPMTAVIILTFYFFLPPMTLQALIAALGGSIIYLSSMIFLTDAPKDVVWNTTLFFFIINGFGLYFLTRFGLVQRREFKALLRLKELAEIDSLTEVFNRRRVIELGERMLRQALRYHESLSILMLDIDRFKAINDDFGHGVGDQILNAVARRCQTELREVDVFGRIGGEEFVAFLPHSDLDQAMAVGERLCKAVDEEKVQIPSGEVGVTVSIGVAALTPGVTNIDALMSNADMALYRAKKSGRNRVCA